MSGIFGNLLEFLNNGMHFGNTYRSVSQCQTLKLDLHEVLTVCRLASLQRDSSRTLHITFHKNYVPVVWSALQCQVCFTFGKLPNMIFPDKSLDVIANFMSMKSKNEVISVPGFSNTVQ